MAKQTEQAQKATLIAQIKVSNPEGTQLVKGFDKAWQLGYHNLTLPVRMTVVGFVRKDS